MTTVTAFRAEMAAAYAGNTLFQALRDDKSGPAVQFKSYEQTYMDSGKDVLVPEYILAPVRRLVAAHVAQQAVQAAVVSSPAPIKAEVVPVAQSRCSVKLVGAAAALAVAAFAIVARQYSV